MGPRERAIAAFIIGSSALAGVMSSHDNHRVPEPIPTTSTSSASETPAFREYTLFHSSSGFEIEYPSDLKQIGDSFRGKRGTGDFYARVRVVNESDSSDPRQTPPLIDSPYIQHAKQKDFTLETVSGLPAVKTDKIIPKKTSDKDINAFESDIRVVSLVVVDRKGQRWVLEFSASADAFPKEFPDEVIGTMTQSFKIVN